MSLILDTGALMAIERADRATVALLKKESLAGRVPLSHGGVVGQAWRGGGPRQARLARALSGLDVAHLDESLGRRVGVLLGRAQMSDVIDAAVVLLAADGDLILTSDPEDLAALAEAAGVHADIVPV